MFSHSKLRWLYIDFNSYFASVEQQKNPYLRGKPVAVMPVDTDSTCAIAASYEAKAFGVKTGMPIWEAKKLCPGIICVLAQHEDYVEYHHRAIEEVNQHIPVAEVCSIDEVACQLMRNEAASDIVTNIALSIKAGLAKTLGPYVRCSIGVAANKYLAKVATDLQKPDGLTILMPEDVEARLTALKPNDLPGIGRNMDRRLRQQGIYTMRDIWALDRAKIRRIWGSILGERMYYQLRGYDLPELETQRRSIGHSHMLAPALRPPEHAINVARRLTLKAAARLRRMEYNASIFGFSARLEDGRRIRAEQKCRPSQDSIGFLAMLLEFWEHNMPKEPGIRVRKISVVLHGLVMENDVQPDLFDPPAFNDMPSEQANMMRRVRLSLALDKINRRFGRDSALIGMTPQMGRGFSGTKIAFTRIPDNEEFLE